MMKTCQGCSYLFAWGGRGYCREPVLPAQYVVDASSGIGSYHECLKYGLGWRDNSTEKCRSVGMPCGPERLLFKPTFFARILRYLKGAERAAIERIKDS